MANLRTQGDIIKEFLFRMNQNTAVAFYTDEIVATWCSNAHAWAAAQKKWPMTEGRYSTTSASMGTNEDGYTTLEYPEGFKQDSIRLLTVGGKRYFKKNFYKFQSFLQDNPNDTTNIFTDFARRVYINPQAGDNSGTVVAWGQINPAPLGTDTVAGVAASIGPDPTSTTIFTDVENEGNDSLVFKMMGYAAEREKNYELLQLREKMAMDVLEKVWNRITEEQYAYHDTDNDGMWKRFDIVRGGFKEDIYKRDQFGW